MNQLQLEGFSTPLIGPFNLLLEQSECVSISGPSGSGKTRLLRAIADLDPYQGELRLDQIECSQYTAPEWRRQVGLLPAESHWWGERVGDHFNGATQHLQALGFEADCLDWDIARLSSGEKQRLALARLLQNQPKVLLLDEPTANLDRRNIERVEALIEGLRQDTGCAVIWVGHDSAQLNRVAARHYRIESGHLKETAWN